MSSLLLVSTLVCFSGYFAPMFIKYLISLIHSDNKTDHAGREELRKLEKEMSGVSLVNEFARFTRLQRRHTKIKEELKQNVSERAALRAKTHLYLTYGNKFLTALVSLMLVYMYGREPIILLPGNLLWPFQHISSWRATEENSISLTTWMIITRLVVDTCKKV